MKSVYLKILLWCFVTLLLSLVAFVLVSAFVSGAAARGGFITDLRAWQTAEAAQAYESGGAPSHPVLVAVVPKENQPEVVVPTPPVPPPIAPKNCAALPSARTARTTANTRVTATNAPPRPRWKSP